MTGNFGEYYQTEGYFFCFNPFGYENFDEASRYLYESTEKWDMIDERTRALILQGTLYH